MFPSQTDLIASKWYWHHCSQVRLALFFLDDNTIIPRWRWRNYFQVRWHDCSQVALPRLFSSDTVRIVSKRHCHDYFQVTLARLLPSEPCLIVERDASTIVPKWRWHNCSKRTLPRSFPSDTVRLLLSETCSIVPSNAGTILFWLSDFYFAFQLVNWQDSSLVRFTLSKERFLCWLLIAINQSVYPKWQTLQLFWDKKYHSCF